MGLILRKLLIFSPSCSTPAATPHAAGTILQQSPEQGFLNAGGTGRVQAHWLANYMKNLSDYTMTGDWPTECK